MARTTYTFCVYQEGEPYSSYGAQNTLKTARTQMEKVEESMRAGGWSVVGVDLKANAKIMLSSTGVFRTLRIERD